MVVVFIGSTAEWFAMPMPPAELTSSRHRPDIDSAISRASIYFDLFFNVD